MRKIFLLLIAWLLSASVALAYTGSYCVSGAGTSAVNGTYTQDIAGVWISSGCAYVMFNAGLGVITPCGTPIGTAFSELRIADNTKGYYYDSHAGTGDVEHFDTVNGDGTAPIPSVTQGACASASVLARFFWWFN